MSDTTWIVGINAVAAVLETRPQAVRELQLASSRHPGRLEPLLKMARAAGIAVRQVDRRDLDRQFSDQRHQGLAALVEVPGFADETLLDELLEQRSDVLLLLLDQVQDPRNFGACLRSAAAAGVDAVVFPKDRAATLTPAARKAAAGAAERVPLVQVVNLAATLKRLKAAGVWLVGADGHAEQPLWEIDLAGHIGVVLGGEGQGLRRLTRDHCDFLACIPMAADVESLNVSVAAGIFLFEAVRQRRRR